MNTDTFFVPDEDTAEDTRITEGKTYFARVYGTWYFGTFSKEWYGWSFGAWGTSGIQLNHIEAVCEAETTELEQLYQKRLEQ